MNLIVLISEPCCLSYFECLGKDDKCLETLLGGNVFVACTRYSMLLVASFSSLYSFSVSPTCRVSLEVHVQRAIYQALISDSECTRT